jgi:hypothetical protein
MPTKKGRFFRTPGQADSGQQQTEHDVAKNTHHRKSTFANQASELIVRAVVEVRVGHRIEQQLEADLWAATLFGQQRRNSDHVAADAITGHREAGSIDVERFGILSQARFLLERSSTGAVLRAIEVYLRQNEPGRHAALRDARIVLLVKTSITKNEMTRPVEAGSTAQR